jgi:hypothetical protein
MNLLDVAQAEEERRRVIPLENAATLGGKRAGCIALCRDIFALKKYCIIMLILLLVLIVEILILVWPNSFPDSRIVEMLVSKFVKYANVTFLPSV